MNTELQQALRTYFNDDQIAAIKWEGADAVIGDARFALSNGKIEIVKVPSGEWLENELRTANQDHRLWTLAAFLKVSHFSNSAKIIEMAKTGEIYNEDYYTKRGAGSPYVNYPFHEGGYDGAAAFAGLADEIIERHHPKTVLDCGCATGVLVKALQDRGVDASGIDISEYATKNAIAKNVFRASGDNLPFPPETFDVVISQDFMEHIEPIKVQAVLKEQARVTKRGGIITHFIPFEKDLDIPRQSDVHLCEASKKFWLAEIAKVPALRIEFDPPEDNQWDMTKGALSRYFLLRKV